jgi:hypothetical protein
MDTVGGQDPMEGHPPQANHNLVCILPLWGPTQGDQAGSVDTFR